MQKAAQCPSTTVIDGGSIELLSKQCRDPQLAEGTSLEGREQPSAGQSIESIQQRSAAVPVPEDTEQDVPAAQEVANGKYYISLESSLKNLTPMEE